jgi:hypothetical protein
MTSLRRTIVAIGALDLAYVAWSAVGALGGAGLTTLWQSTVAFGLPHASLQVAVILAIYLTILVCGLALLFQRATLAWLNYVLFPLRVLWALPTLFPLFVGLSAMGVTLPPAIALAFLAVTEALRVIIVRKWSRRTTAAGGVAGAAA